MKEKILYDVVYTLKNAYTQSVVGPSGIIGGRYPAVLDLVNRIKLECEKLKTKTTEDVPDTNAAKEAANKARKAKKAVCEPISISPYPSLTLLYSFLRSPKPS